MLISYALIYLAMGLSLIIPLAVSWRGGTLLRVFLATWLSVLLFSAFADFAAPAIAKALGEQYKYRQPDVPLTLASVCGGWVYGLFFSGAVFVVRRFRKPKK